MNKWKISIVISLIPLMEYRPTKLFSCRQMSITPVCISRTDGKLPTHAPSNPLKDNLRMLVFLEPTNRIWSISNFLRKYTGIKQTPLWCCRTIIVCPLQGENVLNSGGLWRQWRKEIDSLAPNIQDKKIKFNERFCPDNIKKITVKSILIPLNKNFFSLCLDVRYFDFLNKEII